MSDSYVRFFGLDVHKHYLVALAVDDELNEIYGPQRVTTHNLEIWAQSTLTRQDAVALEVTANAWAVHDIVKPFVDTVLVVHSPHVAVITRSKVKTDRHAALNLARLLAKGLLNGIWVPPQDIRDLRAIVFQRSKMVSLCTQAKCRLRSTMHRNHFLPPDGKSVFSPESLDWWLSLPVTDLERIRIQSDLDTLSFAKAQIKLLEDCLARWAAQDDHIPFLIQITGIGLIVAATIISSVGDIARFPSAKHLVGYAGMGSSVHISGMTSRTGRITKAGRRELRTAMVEAALAASVHDPRWQEEMHRLESRIGRKKAILAVARKMLVVVWHVLAKRELDRLADPQRVARKFMEFAYRLGKEHRGGTAAQYVRRQLDHVGSGQELTCIASGKRKILLPPPGSMPG